MLSQTFSLLGQTTICWHRPPKLTGWIRPCTEVFRKSGHSMIKQEVLWQFIKRHFIERQSIERQFIETTVYQTTVHQTTVYRTESLSNRQFIDRQFIKPTVYRTTVSRTQFIERQLIEPTINLTTVYRTDRLSKRLIWLNCRKTLLRCGVDTTLQCTAAVITLYLNFSKCKSVCTFV